MSNFVKSGDPLKGNSAGFTHQSLFIGLGECCCKCGEKVVFGFAAPQGAVQSLINRFK